MAQRWFASLVPELDVGAKAAVFVISGAVFGAASFQMNTHVVRGFDFVAPCFAEDTPIAVPSQPVELDQSFLLLPAYDLEVTTPSGQATGQPTAQSVRVGDSVTVHLQGDPQGLKSLPATLNIGLPQGTEDLTTSVVIDDKTSGDDHHFKITFIKAGKATIPSLGLGQPGDDAKKFIARTNPMTVDVASSIEKNDPKPKEAAPPLPPERLGFPLWTLIVGGILILALVGAGLYWLIQWSKKRRLELAKRPKGPPPTEDEVALEALKKLEAQGHLRKSEFKKFYFGISDILKHYIGARYKFDAVESTTDEMLDHLERQSGVQNNVLGLLKEMYEKLDLVKFTDHVPVTIEGSELLENARKVVSQTKRQIIISTTGPQLSGDKH
jgi:hypothetical protein